MSEKEKITFFRKVISNVIWVMIILNTVFWDSLQIILSPTILFDRKRKLMHWISMQWGKTLISLNPYWKATVSGLENAKKDETYIIVCNHQSLGDIFVLYSLNRQFKWIAKASLFKIPFIGWAMGFSGYIKLHRGAHGSIRDSFEKAKEWLSRDISVLIFPEGTRSQTGELQAFKNGAFKLAEQTGIKILPVALWGTRDALVKGTSLLAKNVHAQVHVFPPLDPKSFSGGFAEVKEKVRELILGEMERMKKGN